MRLPRPEQKFDSVQECPGNQIHLIPSFASMSRTHFQLNHCSDNLLGLLAWGHLPQYPFCWPLHSYPFDFWRLLPNYYEQYAKRNNLMLLKERFHYLGFGLVSKYSSEKVERVSLRQARDSNSFGDDWFMLFNTFGREYPLPESSSSALTYRTKQRST